MPRSPKPSLQLAVQYPGGKDGAPTRAQVRRYIQAACAVDAEITVRFVDADEGRALNRDYRGKDYATNVLSFPYVQQADQIVGDLALCTSVALREAAEQGKTPEAHLAHLIVHGVLHLLGYDHETGPDDAAEMEAHEIDILATLGHANPYA